MATPKSTLNIHPKVLTALLVGLATTAVGAILAAIHPALFVPLGAWSAPAYSLVVAALSALGGWLKSVQAEEVATPAPAPAPTPAPPTLTPAPPTLTPVGPVTAAVAKTIGKPAAHGAAPAAVPTLVPRPIPTPTPAPAVQSVVIHS